MKIERILLLAGLLFVLPTGATAGTLFGHDVRATHRFPDLATDHFGPSVFTVDNSVEFPNFQNGDYDLDVQATKIRLTLNTGAGWTGASFNGLVLEDAFGTIDAITGVSVNAETTWADITAANLSFDANTVRINFTPDGTTTFGAVDDIVSIDVSFAAVVPEPGSALLALPLLGWALARRRMFSARFARR